MSKLEKLSQSLQEVMGEQIISITTALGEVTIEVKTEHLSQIMQSLRDRPELRFESLVDLSGVDYLEYGNQLRSSARFAAVYHLLSLANNWRVRVRCFAADDDFPVIPSMVALWPGANWYEREAFDFYGIMFTGHPDLRRILTDYGFVGHPFRKDFPLSGHVEMRYDPEQSRVIYQPVTIEPREIVPRVIRETHYADNE